MWWSFAILQKIMNNLSKKILSQIPWNFLWKFAKFQNWPTTYNMKGPNLRFFNLNIWIFPNLAKHPYGWSPLEQHPNIWRKTIRFHIENKMSKYYYFYLFLVHFLQLKHLETFHFKKDWYLISLFAKNSPITRRLVIQENIIHPSSILAKLTYINSNHVWKFFFDLMVPKCVVAFNII